MKNILMIAYYYPPFGGAGVQRSLKFSKYLSKTGYKVFVLTIPDENGSVKDTTLYGEGSENLKIIRTSKKNSNFIGKVANKQPKVSSNQNEFAMKVKKKIKDFIVKVYRSMYIPDDKIYWKDEAVSLAEKIIKDEKIDIIYSTSAPYTSHLVAYELKKKYDLKWIADFRDPWATNPFVEYPIVIQKRIDRLEKMVVNSADSIISVSQPIIDDFLNRYKYLPSDKFKLITNGYGEDDFKDYNLDYKPEKFVLSYNGSLYGKRSPKNFLQAVYNLISTGKIPQSDINIKFIGQIGRNAADDFRTFKSRYKDIIQLVGYLPHNKSIKQLEEASALLLIIEGGRGSEGIYTGKIFEYIRSGRNIIGIVPDGVARDLIKDTNTGFCCYPDSVSEMEDAIYEAYRIWKGDAPKLENNWDEIKKYERDILASQLEDIIKEA